MGGTSDSNSKFSPYSLLPRANHSAASSSVSTTGENDTAISPHSALGHASATALPSLLWKCGYKRRKGRVGWGVRGTKLGNPYMQFKARARARTEMTH